MPTSLTKKIWANYEKVVFDFFKLIFDGIPVRINYQNEKKCFSSTVNPTWPEIYHSV